MHHHLAAESSILEPAMLKEGLAAPSLPSLLPEALARGLHLTFHLNTETTQLYWLICHKV